MARLLPSDPSNYNIIRVPKRVTRGKKKDKEIIKVDGEFNPGSLVEYFLVDELTGG